MLDSPPSNDDALRFFQEFVEPTVAEFMADRANKRRGVLACLVLASMIEHYVHVRFGGNEGASRAFKRTIREDCGAAGWISDVANATRHVVRSVKFEAIGFDDIQAIDMGQCGVLRCD